MAWRYPVRDPREWSSIRHRPYGARIRTWLRNRRFVRDAPGMDGIALEPISRRRPAPAAPSIVLVCVVRDAEKTLPSFLAHYRRLGVGRFAFVDDRSEDATRDLLHGADDVDLYRSNVGFRESQGGLIWRDMLAGLYGRGRWYVSVDADEYLVFPGSEDRPLADFAADLGRARRKRALAVMLDLYPDGPLGSIPPHEPAAAPPVAVCPLFDGDGYMLEHERFATSVRGGPRQRLFGTDMRLSKFPMILVDEQTRFSGGTHHGPLPIHRNYGPVQSVLLHYKFPAGAVAEFGAIAARGSHAGGSAFYKAIVGHEGFHDGTDFRYAGSRRFEGSEALVQAGFMQDLRRAPQADFVEDSRKME